MFSPIRSAAPIATLVLASLSSPAEARRFRLNQIPTAPLQCAQCHVSASGGGPLTAFGLDVNATLSGSDVNWPVLCARDSDNDGATNGAELGDPGCMWQQGDAEPTGPVFDPSDPNSVPPAPDAGVPDQGPADVGFPDTGAPPDMGVMDMAPPDQGVAVDTGPVEDTGVGLDAGVGAAPDMGDPGDAGAGAPDPGPDDTLDSPVGGGCRGSGPRGGSAFLALILAAAGVLVMRRRA